jgi:3-hydroxyethyl bacteriochlorophyllide a dehydrogenase
MHTLAVVLNAPGKLAFQQLELCALGPDDVLVEVEYSGVSTGTERLLWTGRMPPFPGMGYPLVPGYESVGRVVDAGANARQRMGERVFVPGASCYRNARGLFGGTARRVIVPAIRAIPVSESLAEKGVLLALAATAFHAISGGRLADLIVGHGVLGRLIARLSVLAGGDPPTVWETNPARHGGAEGYHVVDPADDDRRDYATIYDVSGDSTLLDTLIGRIAKGGEIVLAGFYDQPLSFAFPQAFMREAHIRVAAEWRPDDLAACNAMLDSAVLSFDGLISHRQPAEKAEMAYPAAFGDPGCLKMVLDWRGCA